MLGSIFMPDAAERGNHMNLALKYLTSALGFSNTQQTVITTSGGIIGVFIGYVFGEFNGYVELLIWAIILDYASGCLASLKEKKGLNSEVGFWGLVKKVLTLAAVFFGHRADLAFGTNSIMTGLLTAFLINELVSLGENYGRIGLPLSQYLVPLISILKPKGAGDNASKKPE